MLYEISEEQRIIINTLRGFCEEKVKPVEEENDREGRYPEDLVKEMAKLGFFGSAIPEKYGGNFVDYFTLTLLSEEFSKYSPSLGTIMGASSLLFGNNLSRNGTEEQKKKYLPLVASGEWMGCMGLTEPGAGSDAMGLSTTAKKVGDEYILNGTKTFISNAPVSDVALVYATLDKSLGPKGICTFIVESGFEGYSAGKKFDKMGLRSSPTGELVFEDCRVPAANLVGGEEGLGAKQMIGGLDTERVGWGAMSLGLAQGAFDEALKYSMEREQFGGPIYNFQMIQKMIADMATEIEAARLLLYNAAAILDKGGKARLAASYAKLFSCDMCMRVTTDAVQIHGGYGYIKEFRVERMMRDAKIFSIGAGTSEVQRMIICHYLRP
ncbi:MAG: acyl-CoA dehydrogenase family protein [Deltaproteobacteria bacterium]|uniref:Acyl-CoA dehydrogenase family protein n=1 Tax=Candidatus Zymogenus saltonus TaxID=2844893 RepID=A0A9D8KD66_9DELT|nr:acyl-CoA dehydrogenase family protein [Candidatus Zymogenus saltonus]